VKGGAHIVDVCLQSTERDEKKDIPPFFERLIRKVKTPIMIDTTDAQAVEQALTYCQGKSLINSINLEDGEEKFERVCPLAHSYGAAVVVGCIDEDPVQAQAFTRERKLSIAQRSHKLLTEKYGITPENIVFDPLVFPCATGDENYVGGAVETIEGIRFIKQQIPFVRTVLGISNVSFGLPAGAREVVNSVFLYYCTKAGLDLAIVNAERLERFPSIPEKERTLAEDLLFNHVPKGVPENHPAAKLLRGAPDDWRQQSREQKIAINQFHIAAITEHFRTAKKREKAKAADLPLDQRLANYILEGSKDGLVLVDDSVLRYYLHPALRQDRMTDPFYFRYRDEAGEAAYAAAVGDGYFDYVTLDGGMGDEARRMRGAILSNIRSSYRLAVKMPEANLGQQIEIYERMDPPPARPATAGPTIEILAPVNSAVVKTNDKSTLLRGTVRGAGTGWYVLVDVYTNRWYPQGGKIFPASANGAFFAPIFLGGKGQQQCYHIVRAQLYDEHGRRVGVTAQFGVARANGDAGAPTCP
jgi:hypothetical protein